MKKYVFVACVIVLCVLMLCGCAPKAESKYNVDIINGGESSAFDYDGTLSALQEDWSLTSGGTVSETFSNSSDYLAINTASAGYAAASQTVYLKPYSYYKVRYSFTSTSMSAVDSTAGYVGLYVGFQEDNTFNNPTGDKTTEHRGATTATETGEFYFKTENVREAAFTIYVGTEENPVSVSSVVVKDITLERVTKADAIEHGNSVGLYTLHKATYGKPTLLNNLYVILGGVGTLLLAYAFYMLRARARVFENGEASNKFAKLLTENKYLGLLLVLGAGLLVRLAILLTESLISGQSIMQTVYYGYALEQNAAYGIWLAKYGMPYFFDYNATASFMPFGLYFSTVAGLIGRIAEAAGASQAVITLVTASFIKALAVAADLGVAAIIFKIVSDKQGKLAATIMAGFYTLIPAVFSMSAAWGSMESISTFFVVLAFYFILNKKFYAMAGSYFAAALISPSALLVCPFVLCYTAMLMYRGIREKKLWGWLAPALTIVGSLVLFFLVTLPYSFNEVGNGDVMFAFTKYVAAVKGSNFYTINAFNFQGLLGNNFKSVSNASLFVTILFVLFIVALFAASYFKNKSRLQLFMLAGGFTIVFWTLCNNMLPETLFVALPLVYIYTAMVKDKRLYVGFALYAALVFVNSAYIFMVNGYDAAGPLQLSYDTAMMYVFGPLALALIIYFVIVAYDSVVHYQSSEFLTLRVPYGSYVTSVTQNVLITLRNMGAKAAAVTKSVGNAIKEDAAVTKAKWKASREAKKNASGKDDSDSK